MSGRLRRVVQNRSAATVASALEQIAAAKSGAKRVETFKLKEEEDVYDEVDEDSYAQLVTRRRMEAGDFIEDDAGEEDYMETGEEEELFKQQRKASASGTKRKGEEKDASAAKRKAAEDALKANAAKERLQKMFAKAAAQKPANAAPKVDDKAADDLLEGILGDLGSDKPSTAANGSGTGNRFARMRVSGGSNTAASSGVAAVAGPVKTFSRGGARCPAASMTAAAAGSGRVAAATSAATGRIYSNADAGVNAIGHKRSAALSESNAAGADDGSDGPSARDSKPQSSLSFGGVPGNDDIDRAVGGGVSHQGPETAADNQQEFSFSQPGAATDVSDNPFAAKPDRCAAAATTDSNHSRHAAATAKTQTPVADDKDFTGAAVKRFADDIPLGPDVQASPTTGWMEVYGSDVASAVSPQAATADDASLNAAAAGGGAESSTTAASSALVQDESGSVPFFFMDAYESPDRPDNLYLLGKVEASNSNSSNTPGSTKDSAWQSCCVVVPNMHRSLLVVPTPDIFGDASGEISALEAAVAEDPSRKMELLQLLHQRCADLKAELRTVMLTAGIKSMRLVPVKRRYAFEDPAIPAREQWVLKVRYSACLPTLPLGTAGKHFVAIAGTNQSLLEALIIKRGLRGPCWTTLQAPVQRVGSAMVSWCKVEVELANAKALKPAEAGSQLGARPPPPLTVAALNLRLHMDPKTQAQEILAASVVHMSGVSMDAPTPRTMWGNPHQLRNFSIVRKLNSQPWPTGFEQLVATENASPRGRANGCAMLATAPNERALLGCLLAKLAALDADVLVGHNIGAYELVVLLGRLQKHKVQLWSRLGRLKRNSFPKLTGGGHTFGGGAGPGLMAALAGRLLCDTYLSARELVREVDYTLKTLAQNLLGQARAEVATVDVPGRYDSAAGLRELLLLGESDAWLALGLAFQLSVLPLTKQLSVVSGSLWSKTLQGARAQRIEMLLLHEFHARKFILPGKLSQRDKAALAAAAAAGTSGGSSGRAKGPKDKAAKGASRNSAADTEDYVGPALPEDDADEEESGTNQAAAGSTATGNTADLSKNSGGKGPQYAGGLVLEPKKGLYDKYVIMLDFNSLYPSIIQEYNICFTTVKRPTDGSMPALPHAASACGSLAPLPTVIQGLVKRRREVKAQMKHCRDAVQLQQLQVRQQALKLTANSMYGCLGFNNSRFFARPLAELITSQGREILQSTVDLVQDMGVPGLEVIYGDTDSIMIHTNSNDYDAAEQLGGRIKAAVNRRYRLLEIELDAVYRSMLLLKKKKYAAYKVERTVSGNTQLVQTMETKGLDMVRRDWCVLSKDTGNFALEHILSGKPKAEVVEAVHDKLKLVAEQLRTGQLPLRSFIITKQLTKRPEDYPDARVQPHVQVALRRRAAGKRDGVMSGETVPYVICLKLANDEAENQQQQQHQQQDTMAVKQEPDTSQQEGTSREAAAIVVKQEDGQQEPQQQQSMPGAVTAAASSAAAGKTPSKGVRAAFAGGAAAGGGSLAERAYHPDELRSDPSLVIDADYYLGQQVLPVVMRLCAPIEGTNASHLAQCLGLDPSRFGGSGGSSSNSSLAAALRDEAMQVTGSIFDDDSHYARCDPLLLTSPNNTTWEFQGVRAAIKSASPRSVLLTPPDAVGDPAAEVKPAQLANQALLAARKAIIKYYDGHLAADDEMASAESSRDVTLAPAPTDAGPGTIPRAAAVGQSGGSGVLLSRAVSEGKLYTQLCHIVRLLDVKAALDTLPDKQRKEAALQQLSESAAGGSSLVATLNQAAAVVSRLRDSCAYRWVNLGQLFGRLRPERPAGVAR